MPGAAHFADVIQITTMFIKAIFNFFMMEVHIETNLLIWSANEWTGVFMKGTSIMKQLSQNQL